MLPVSIRMNYPKRTSESETIHSFNAQPPSSPLTPAEMKLLRSDDRKFLDVLRLSFKYVPHIWKRSAPYLKSIAPIFIALTLFAVAYRSRESDRKYNNERYGIYLAEKQSTRLSNNEQTNTAT